MGRRSPARFAFEAHQSFLEAACHIHRVAGLWRPKEKAGASPYDCDQSEGRQHPSLVSWTRGDLGDRAQRNACIEGWSFVNRACTILVVPRSIGKPAVYWRVFSSGPTMPLHWNIDHHRRRVSATVLESTTEQEMYDFLGDVIAADAMPYAKLFDATRA